MFNQGMWMGQRFHSAVTAAPTTGEYAAGDILFNQTPNGVSAPSGWICTTGGAIPTGATAWVANTTYAIGAIVLNDSGKAYVCINPGISGGNPAWAASTAYAVGVLRTNGGNTYICITAGTSAASGGPTGTGADITDGTVHWSYVDPALGAHPIWANSTYYRVNDAVVNAGSLFLCNDNGTSAATGTGPTGAGGLDGSVNWTHIVPTAMASTGPAGTGSYIADASAVWSYKPPFVFTAFDGKLSQQTLTATAGGGVAFTLTPGTSQRHTLYVGTMTADKSVSLSLTNANKGGFFRITRTAAGAFNLNVYNIDLATGPLLKALAVNTWCEVAYDGAAWYLSAYGTL
jgi:hypothetical protein